MKFSEFSLEPTLQSGIDKLGFLECTPIQAQSLQPILSGQDVAGLAQTGTGKTAAFLVPILERVLRSKNVNADLSHYSEEIQKEIEKRKFPDWKPQQYILILVPTRELADQVQENLTKISADTGIRSVSIFGGTGYDKQKEGLRQGVEFVIATPGRLIDLYKEHFIDLKQVRAIIFDEADRMFDMGFKDDMSYILQRVPKERQYLVFSATLNFDVLNTAYQFGANPIELNVSRDQTKAENVKDQIFHVGHDEKPQHLLSLLKLKSPKQTIIFSNFKHNVERIAQFLIQNDVPAMAISSLLSQAQRTKVMQQFKEENEHNVLVATDVAARGLDIQGVDLVVNYELPNDSESYVHRIGRTGRAGATGQAYSLVCDKDIDSLNRIEEYLKHKLDVGYLEDVDLIKEFKAFPSSAENHFGSRDHNRGGSRQGKPRSERKFGNQRHQSARASGSHSASAHENSNAGFHKPKKHGAAPFAKNQDHNSRSAEKSSSVAGRSHKFSHHKSQSKTEGSRSFSKHGKQGPSHSQRTRPHHGGAGHAKPAAKTSSHLGQKVVGFFKKLFGQ